jgi:hypothetical protein
MWKCEYIGVNRESYSTLSTSIARSVEPQTRSNSVMGNYPQTISQRHRRNKSILVESRSQFLDLFRSESTCRDRIRLAKQVLTCRTNDDQLGRYTCWTLILGHSETRVETTPFDAAINDLYTDIASRQGAGMQGNCSPRCTIIYACASAPLHSVCLLFLRFMTNERRTSLELSLVRFQLPPLCDS